MAFRIRSILLALFCLTALISAFFSLFGCIQEASQPASNAAKGKLPDGKTTDKAQPEGNLLAEGADLFTKFCISCHGTAGNGRGSRSGPSLQRPELTYGRTPAAITQSIREGRPGGMPAFGHVFTPRQLEALSTYILSLKK
jgi:cytochrome c oxidase cbb3-type subunit 3